MLDVASVRWPDTKPLTLMINLMELGTAAVEKSVPNATSDAHLADLERLAHQIDVDYGHLYTDDYLDEVRDGWE